MRLILDKLIDQLQQVFRTLPDPRNGQNTQYRFCDVPMAAFSMFHIQSPSFLQYQSILQEQTGRNNCQSLYRMKGIPTDNHIRNLLDGIDPYALNDAFDIVPNLLAQHPGAMKPFQYIAGRILIAVDGTEFHSSYKIKCNQCSTRQRKGQDRQYFHSVVVPAMVAPGHNKAIPLVAEFITPQDGDKKQDCEIKAIKRWLHAHGVKFGQLYRPIYLGDDLYSRQPVCELIEQLPDSDFIFTAKRSSHQLVYEYLDEVKVKQITRHVKNKRNRKVLHRYRWMNNLPLRNGTDALNVNWMSLQVVDGKKITYHNDFVTSVEVNRDNVVELTTAGRSRWKIENETFNILKNQGYHLEHNFGHGQRGLTNTLVQLNLLAFAFHTACDLACELWQQARKRERTRVCYFQTLGVFGKRFLYDNWYQLLDFVAHPRAPPN